MDLRSLTNPGGSRQLDPVIPEDVRSRWDELPHALQLEINRLAELRDGDGVRRLWSEYQNSATAQAPIPAANHEGDMIGDLLKSAPPANPGALASSWHWCPTCNIASVKPGECPTCVRPMVPAPPEGLPYGPYQPPSVRRRSKSRLVMPMLTLALFVATAVSGVWLYRTGTPAQTASGAPDGLVHTSAQTSVHLPELGIVNLPGTWVEDPILAANLQTSLNSDGGQGQELFAWRSGNTVLWMATLVKAPKGTGAGSDPCTYTPTGNGTLTIASKPAERADLTSACPSGTSYIREYDMQDTGATLILKIVSPSAQPPFTAIEAALVVLPGSLPGGVKL